MTARDRALAPASPSISLEIRAALALLTRVPVALPDGRSGSAAFALVGGLLGLAAAIPAWALATAAPLLGTVLALGFLAVATGVLHLDGLADTADALAAPTPERAEAARKDPRIGSAGATALVIALGACAGALLAVPQPAIPGALLVAGAASRAVPAVGAPLLAGRERTDAPRGGFGAWFIERSGPGGAAAAILTAVLAVALAAAMAAGMGAPGAPWVAIAASLVGGVAGLGAGLGLLAWLQRRFGQLAGDFFGASIEVAFAAALAATAIAWGGLA